MPSQQPLPEIPKLPALRADVSAKGRARHLGFLLLSRRSVQNRLILPVSVFPTFAAFPLSPNPLCWALVEFSVLPHGGATSGLRVSGGYALDCAAKAAQTADTGATARNALPVTSASPAWAHPAPAKSPDRADSAVCAPAAYSRLPSFHAAPLSLPHSGDR